ncbi:P2Y purinoceptor 1-like [Boleophthalmus pectinirostris]|uniref:P2Y purinoceptor 1-like n=1 Tax=Boleophthalmus pectinirostris TaxID=150288 RepID=UPI002430B074|nr:P2Y purinoceptor 1-like [Boleophthalmus pectinirostris]
MSSQTTNVVRYTDASSVTVCTVQEVCSQSSSFQCYALYKMDFNKTKPFCFLSDITFADRFLPPVYILVFIIGLSANIWGLKFLLQNWKKFGHINIFVFNLGLADILYLLTLPFLVDYHFRERKWIFGDTFCKITRFCFNINLYGSIGFLTCISVYRYFSIVHPLKIMGKLSPSRSAVISVMVWLFVGVQTLPDMFFTKTKGKKPGKCYDTTSSDFLEEYLKYSLGWTVTGFCLPFLVMVGCYTHVIVKLCGSSSTDTNHVLKRRSLRLLLVLILLFSVCYIPYHVLRNLNLCSRVLIKRKQCYSWFDPVYMAQQVGRGLASLNPALNPLVYLHVSDELSFGLRALHRHMSVFWSSQTVSASQAQSVIQAP